MQRSIYHTFLVDAELQIRARIPLIRPDPDTKFFLIVSQRTYLPLLRPKLYQIIILRHRKITYKTSKLFAALIDSFHLSHNI